jgi:hypothetical protein
MIVNLVRLPSGIEAGPGIDADESDSVEGYIPMVTLADFERGNGLASAVGRECIELAGASPMRSRSCASPPDALDIIFSRSQAARVYLSKTCTQGPPIGQFLRQPGSDGGWYNLFPDFCATHQLGRHRRTPSFWSRCPRIAGSVGHADCQQSFVVYLSLLKSPNALKSLAIYQRRP